MFEKKLKPEVGEMVHELKACTALTEELSSVVSTNFKQLRKPLITPAPGDLIPFLTSLAISTYMYTYMQTYIRITIK